MSAGFKLGQMVMLIGTDGFMPPLGAVGEIVGLLDEGGDYEVMFPQHPCPTGPELWWLACPSWLMPINPDAQDEQHIDKKELLG